MCERFHNSKEQIYFLVRAENHKTKEQIFQVNWCWGGSMIPGFGVPSYIGSGGWLCRFYLIYLKCPMKMK